MKRRLNVSLSLKLTIIVVIVSAISISFVTIYHISNQEEFFQGAYYPKAFALTQALNATIGDIENLKDTVVLKNKVWKFINSSDPQLKNEILKVVVNLPDENDELTIAYSTSENEIGSPTNYMYYNDLSFRSESKNDSYFILENTDDLHTLTSIYPINLTGSVDGSVKLDGTYEIVLSMNNAYAAQDTRVRNIIFISIFSMFFMVFAFLYLLSKITVKPITHFREKVKKIGKGELDTKIDIKSRDELGELASAFNQMTKDLKESRDKIHEYNTILENLLDQKDEFIGQLGHDLKNPLQPLVGLLPMLIDQEKDPKIKETLIVMNKNAEYMRDLIFETLQLAKLRSSDIKFDIKDVNLREESDAVIESQKLLLKEHKITVDNKISKDIIIQADRLRLAEVFKNLITNSVKYTSDAGGKITLNAEQESNIVTVSIKDTGIGMTEEQLKKVFDEFYKANRLSGDYHSTGLGLAICKRIVEKLDGKIWVESQGSGKGSTFYFTLKTKSKNN